MNKDNFADWEITKMLPQKQIEVTDAFSHIFLIEEDNEVYNLLDFEEIPEKYTIAWTWEDIRIYLESKKVFINNEHRTFVNTSNLNATELEMCGYQVTIKFYENSNSDSEPRKKNRYLDEIVLPNLSKTYPTYEEARREAIKYCLSLNKEDEHNGGI